MAWADRGAFYEVEKFLSLSPRGISAACQKVLVKWLSAFCGNGRAHDLLVILAGSHESDLLFNS